jgi:hypothetical protein
MTTATNIDSRDPDKNKSLRATKALTVVATLAFLKAELDFEYIADIGINRILHNITI